MELAYPHTHLLSGPLGVSERLIVSEQLEEYKPKEDEQLPKRPWLNIIVLILAAPILNTVTYKIYSTI